MLQRTCMGAASIQQALTCDLGVRKDHFENAEL
jgi:hypothetical protein